MDMELGPIIVISLRLIIPFLIFRFKLLGVILSAIADGVDVILITFINSGELTNYHLKDKLLDIYYLSFAAFVSLQWKNLLARKASIVLFLYRVVGLILFEVTHARFVLFLFPNLFENFYVFYLAYLKITKKDPVKSYKSLTFILVLLLIPKLAQEYFLHVYEAQPWKWFRTELLHMKR